MQPLMRYATLLLIFVTIASNAHAQSRYEIAQMSCSEVQQTLDANGSAILRYPSQGYFNLSLYDLYVAGQAQCQQDEVVRQVGVPTADSKYCPVHKCVESSIFVSR